MVSIVTELKSKRLPVFSCRVEYIDSISVSLEQAKTTASSGVGGSAIDPPRLPSEMNPQYAGFSKLWLRVIIIWVGFYSLTKWAVRCETMLNPESIYMTYNNMC